MNLNMPVMNYVVHRFFRGLVHRGAPVTSRFKAYETRRRDVWFIDKWAGAWRARRVQ